MGFSGWGFEGVGCEEFPAALGCGLKVVMSRREECIGRVCQLLSPQKSGDPVRQAEASESLIIIPTLGLT